MSSTPFDAARARQVVDTTNRWMPLFAAIYGVGALLAYLSGPTIWWHAAVGGLIWAALARSMMKKGAKVVRTRPHLRGIALKTLLPLGVFVGASWLLFSEDVARSALVGALVFMAALALFARALTPLMRLAIYADGKAKA